VITTPSAGNFTVNYQPGDTFSVDGTTTTIATFESSLSVGDAITFRGTTAAGTTQVNHALTNQ